MEQVFEFIGNHPIMVGAFALLLVVLIITEIGRFRRGFREISTQEAVLLINRQNAGVLDVSAIAEFNKSHIVGAQHLALSQIQASNGQLMKLKDRPLLVYCRNGISSTQAALQLVSLGLGPVSVLRGGMAQWQADKQPVTSGR